MVCKERQGPSGGREVSVHIKTFETLNRIQRIRRHSTLLPAIAFALSSPTPKSRMEESKALPGTDLCALQIRQNTSTRLPFRVLSGFSSKDPFAKASSQLGRITRHNPHPPDSPVAPSTQLRAQEQKQIKRQQILDSALKLWF